MTVAEEEAAPKKHQNDQADPTDSYNEAREYPNDKKAPATVATDSEQPPSPICTDLKGSFSPEHEREKKKAAPLPAPPSFPDGGFTAWLQCAGSFFMFFNCWGVVNSFGEQALCAP